MEDKVFRKKNLERISSAEELHQYMRVTSLRLWMFLALIIVLVAGFIIFACFVKMENVIDSKAEVMILRPDDESEARAFIWVDVPENATDIVKKGMTVRIAGEEGIVTNLLYADDNSARVELNDPSVVLEEGNYDAQFVLEKISPISFLIN